MTEPFFIPNDAKYKCFFELFHVKTWATIICAFDALFYLSVGCNIFYGHQFDGYESLSYWYFSAVIFATLILLLALYGIIYSKPELIDFVCCNLIGRIIILVVILLFFFAADIPASPVKDFCRYLAEQISGEKDATIINISDGNTVCLHFAAQLVIEYYFYIILNKCRQYIIDKNAYDKLTLPQSKLPPAYQV